MFNIHFSVLTNFVTFVYLAVFLSHFVSCSVLSWLLLQDILKTISKFHNSHKSHYLESRYQHSIRNGIVLQKFYFFRTNFFGKKRTSISSIPDYFFNDTLMQLLISLQISTHPFRGIHWCSRQKNV